ncbi:hypothetical protein CTA1_11546 [Colletotrichum tanaceti]|uniref:Uncharacterized protein n=1 Tax=Colletotrichum tanaceti TaxID=1306861 RepID=A0A4U6XPL4_9PEZI|nr:hypothetical protein CTA1_11546 [Colletotrichum tanaceti]
MDCDRMQAGFLHRRNPAGIFVGRQTGTRGRPEQMWGEPERIWGAIGLGAGDEAVLPTGNRRRTAPKIRLHVTSRLNLGVAERRTFGNAMHVCLAWIGPVRMFEVANGISVIYSEVNTVLKKGWEPD